MRAAGRAGEAARLSALLMKPGPLWPQGLRGSGGLREEGSAQRNGVQNSWAETPGFGLRRGTGDPEEAAAEALSWARLGLLRPRRRGDPCVLSDPVPEATLTPRWCLLGHSSPRNPTPRPELGNLLPSGVPRCPRMERACLTTGSLNREGRGRPGELVS